MRFSIKDVFVLVALCAVILSAGAYVGFNGLFVFVLIVSAVMTAIFVPLAALRQGRGFAVFVPLIFIGFGAFAASGLFFSMALLINAVALLILSAVLGFLPKRRVIAVLELSLACAAIAMALGVLPGLSVKEEFAALRAEFPEVSLVSRLNYETTNHVAADQPELAEVVLARLATREKPSPARWNSRASDLESIHDWNTEMFARSIGFGVSRMSFRPNEGWLRKGLNDVAFNEKAKEYSGDWDTPGFGTSTSVQSLHDASEFDFLNREYFGAIVGGASKVIGFVEHALHHSPRGVLKDPGQFLIERMELVSLLKHGEPRVYVLDHMPRMDQLSAADAPTRALDEFESDALKKLRADEDIVVSQNGNKYRMLGSLRATTECVQCHAVQRGELLGAFSYVIRGQ
jgi:hypothetical protein